MVKHLYKLLLFIQCLSSQPDARFRAFDWVVYRGAGEINALAEGHQFIYIATSHGGLQRFNHHGETFEDPITMAQGLKSNEITATHFDPNSGILWVTTPNAIQYSFSQEGDWFSRDFEYYGLNRHDRITQIGSSQNFIWLRANSSYVKISQSSGTLIGIYPTPDELNISWSSGRYVWQPDLMEIFETYSVMDGWTIVGDDFIDPLGRRVQIKTGLLGNYNRIYVGGSDGTFFFAHRTMETFYPLSSGITNIGVTAMADDGDDFWLGSHDFIASKGISLFNSYSTGVHTYLFDETINMTPMPVYSMFVDRKEAWVGGERKILYYNKKKDFWRTLGEESGISGGTIWDIEGDETYLWVGSNLGLSRINRETNRSEDVGIEHLFSQRPVFDIEIINEEVWIGTRSGIFIFNPENPLVQNAEKIGRKDFPEFLHWITSIEESDRDVYVAGNMGIAKFSPSEREWKLLFPAVVYHGKTIYSMAINQNHIFLGTEDGLVRIHKNTGLLREYSFNFIGQVNDIILDGKTVWLGTSEGLIKFKWKRDL